MAIQSENTQHGNLVSDSVILEGASTGSLIYLFWYLSGSALQERTVLLWMYVALTVISFALVCWLPSGFAVSSLGGGSGS